LIAIENAALVIPGRRERANSSKIFLQLAQPTKNDGILCEERRGSSRRHCGAIGSGMRSAKGSGCLRPERQLTSILAKHQPPAPFSS